jgi:hypothetical protein
MDIRINDWHIGSDNFNLILSKVKTRKSGKDKGEEFTELVGFYPTLDLVFGAILKKSMFELEKVEVEKLKQEYEDFLNNYKEACLALINILSDTSIPKDE